MQSIRPYLKNKEHIIWDWNGTLLNDIDCAVDVICELLAEQGKPAITREAYLDHFGFPVMDYYRRVGFDFNQVSFEILSDKFISRYQARVRDCQIHPGTRELLEEVKALGRTQSVLSAAMQSHLLEQIGHQGIQHFFDHIFGLGDHYAASKMERGRELIKTVGIPIENTILIGDTDHDLEVGKDLGIDVLLIADGHQSHARLKKIHHQVLATRH